MTKSEMLPFIAPFFLFAVFLTVQGFFPDQHYALYPLITVLEGAAIVWFWRALPTLTPSAPIFSVCVGIVGVILWIGLDPAAVRLDIVLEQIFNHIVSLIGLQSWKMDIETLSPVGRNPFLLYPTAVAWILFAFRVAGIAICVPIMEELFWRGFLMRYLIKEDFASVPLGTYQPMSFWVTTAFFASVHGSEWPLAVIVGVLYGAWFIRTKRLGDIMVAHGVTNLLLALYCLITHDWHFLSTVTPAPAHK